MYFSNSKCCYSTRFHLLYCSTCTLLNYKFKLVFINNFTCVQYVQLALVINLRFHRRPPIRIGGSYCHTRWLGCCLPSNLNAYWCGGCRNGTYLGVSGETYISTRSTECRIPCFLSCLRCCWNSCWGHVEHARQTQWWEIEQVIKTNDNNGTCSEYSQLQVKNNFKLKDFG